MSDDEYQHWPDDRATIMYRHVRPQDVHTSKEYEHFRDDPDLIQYVPKKAKAKAPNPEEKLYVYVPTTEPKAKPKPPQDEDDTFVYVPRYSSKESKPAPRPCHIPVPKRVVTTKQKSNAVWLGRTKDEVEEDNAIIAERRGVKIAKESPSKSQATLWLGRAKEEVAEDNANRAKRHSMPSPPCIIKGPPRYKDDDLIWVHDGGAELSLHSYATVKHLDGVFKQDSKDAWYFAMD